MTAWQEYLLDVYITCKFLVALACIPLGVIIAGVAADNYNLTTAVAGVILAFLGLAIPLLLPTQAILIKLLGW